MTKYEVGQRIRFPLAGNIYRITAVTDAKCMCGFKGEGLPSSGHHPECPAGDESQRRVSFAPDWDPENEGSETVADLDAVPVQVLAGRSAASEVTR